MKFSRIVVLGAVGLAVAESHKHAHLHRRHGSPVEARNPEVVETVPGPVVTVFELNGQDISQAEVEAGLKDGKYVLVGEKISTVIPKPSTTKPKKSPTPSADQAAKFFEKASSTTSSTTTTTTTTTTTPPPPSTTSPAPSSSATPSPSSAPSTGNIDSDFPSGTYKCSEFPSQYGAVYLDYLGHNGWSGVQRVPNFNFGSDTSISSIDTAIDGEGCTPNSFCSYACPAGYQKSQWPAAQGNTLQSIGGLYCNPDGYLVLSKPAETKICIPGVGGIKIRNKLSQNAAVCRTDYPGTESETIPLNTQPGGEYELCNPDQTTYYQWNNSPTSAQYYVNNAGVSQDKACDWGVAGSNMGNWAPVNVGVGRGSDGVTYISIFPNAPTNPDGKLNFNIEIKGDVSGDCAYRNGQYYNNGSPASTGCTAGVRAGGQAYFEFS